MIHASKKTFVFVRIKKEKKKKQELNALGGICLQLPHCMQIPWLFRSPAGVSSIQHRHKESDRLSNGRE